MTHLRNIGAAVLGYLVMGITVFVLFLVVGLVMVMADSGGFVVASIVISLVAALIGGIVCAKVAADARGVWILIAAVVVVGVVMAIRPDTPVEAVTEGLDPAMAEMMESAAETVEEPAWLQWLTPFLGAVGVFLGARLVKGD